MSPRVAFVVDRPWSAGSVLPAVVARLRADRADVAICARPTGKTLGKADLVVLAMRDPARLRALAEPLAHAGARCCNTIEATAAARDKIACERALAAAGVPRPRAAELESWDEVVAAARSSDLLVKPVTRSRGRDPLDARRLPEVPPFPGPYLVQERVEHDGLDRKLYVVGDDVRGVLRRWPWRSREEKLGRAFVPDGAMRRIALAAGRALGLELYGVDVLVGPDGPVVVDVNALPGYKGAPGAEELLARYLLQVASDAREARCVR